MKNKKFFISIIFTLACCLVHAQSIVLGAVLAAPDSSAIHNCYIALIQNDSIVKSATTEPDGAFFIKDVKHGQYTIEVDAFGYENQSMPVNVTERTLLTIVLQPRMSKNLGEVTVNADRSNMVNHTANGQIFYLSAEAKKKSNPFLALQEIPILITNVATTSVKLLNDNNVEPLILINGQQENSGIAPISPADIESVEVITNPSARYLKEGIKSIINIKLKRKEKPYQWYELATRNDIPLFTGFGAGYFEIGNPKYSLYGRASADYVYKSDYIYDVERYDTNYSQNYHEHYQVYGWNWVGELLFKANPNKSNYYAIHAYGYTRTKKSNSNGQGDITSSLDVTTPYDFSNRNRDESTILTGSAYYKHDFNSLKTFEARLAYNYNKNNQTFNRTDEYQTEIPTLTINELLYHNKRHSGSLELDYTNTYNALSTISFGAHTSFQSDRIANIIEPQSLFRHSQVSQYVYAGWSTKLWQKIWFNSSLGMDYIRLKTDNFKKDYIIPRANVSLTWPISNYNSISFSYRFSNMAPEVNQLNPYNTSNDTLSLQIGNPRLKPESEHIANLSYTQSINRFYITPTVGYRYAYDRIESTGYTNSDGVHVYTYINQGHIAQIDASTSLRYRLNNGSIYATFGWYKRSYDYDIPHKNTFFSIAGFNYQYKKFYFSGSFAYKNQEVNGISWMRYDKPRTADLQVNYFFTPDFYIGVCLQQFTGKYRTTTHTATGTFHSKSISYCKDKNFLPWVILRYTFRKNSDRKINLDKVLESQEMGIKL